MDFILKIWETCRLIDWRIVWHPHQRGCIELLDRYNIDLNGKNVVVLGRSNIVGLPVALLALHRNATVSICHSKTKNIQQITSKADVLVCACGRREMVNADWIKEGCVIVDVGINAVDDPSKKEDID